MLYFRKLKKKSTMKKKYLNLMKKIIFIFFLLFTQISLGITIYVNDSFTSDDVFCSVVGNDLNNGLSTASPKLSLSAAIAIANNGDLILVDTGTYSGANNRSMTINKEIEIRGAGELKTIFDNATNTQRWGSITANNVKISLLTIKRYSLNSDGIAITIPSGIGIELNRVLIYANVGSAGQGAVHILGSSTSVTIKNTSSPCNRVASANYGGGYKISGSTVVFENCSINNNVISGLFGGGMLIEGSTANVTINNCTFDENQAMAGGAICIRSGLVNINNTCFNNNTTEVLGAENIGGGAVLVQAETTGTTTTVNFNNCSFNNNSTGPASSDGGAVTVSNFNSPTCNVVFNTCSFANNNAQDKGEDVYFDLTNAPTHSVIFRNCSFLNVYSGSQVNVYNLDFPAASIRFEQLPGFGANGDVVADGSGAVISNPEMTGLRTEVSVLSPVGLPLTNCYDRFDGICGGVTATFACLTENIWNGTTWSRGTIPTKFEHVILNSNYNTAINGNIDACQMTVRPGIILDIENSTDGTYVYVVNSIFNYGVINVKSKGNLIQVNHPLDLNGEPIVTPNINFTKNTASKVRWDYIYWSKPIVNPILPELNSNFDLKYYWDPDFCVAGVNQSYLGWRTLSSEPAIGTGFIARVKTSIGLTPTNFTINLSGLSNNGNYTSNVKYYDTNDNAFRNFTLLGNPYPGAIKFEDFYNDNKNSIYGTVYLWTSYTVYSGTGEYRQADYASFNLTGGVGVSGASTQSPSSVIPNGYIPSGQGFMVRPKLNGTVTFKNSHRTKEIPSNNQFFRSDDNQKDRFWLRLKTSNGNYNETLIGYLPNSSLNFDEAYDGPINSLSSIKFYSILNEEKLIIQSRGKFDINDKVEIDYKLQTTEDYLTISLAHKEGVFQNQQIILHDKMLGFYQNLQDGDYIFKNENIENRFEIIYKSNKDIFNSTNDFNLNVFVENGFLNIDSNQNLKNITLMDLNGKIIYDKYIHDKQKQYSVGLQISNGIYLLKVENHMNEFKTLKVIF